MNDTVLTSEEKKELGKRGFYVKETVNMDVLMGNVPFQIMLLALFSGIGFIIGMIITLQGYHTENIMLESMFITTIPVFLYIIKKSLLRYIFLGKKFYSGSFSAIFPYGSKLLGNEDSSLIKITDKIQSDSKSLRTMIHTSKKKDVIGVPVFLVWICIFIFGNSEVSVVIGGDLFSNFILPLLALFGLLYLVAAVFHSLIEHFHPLYAFGNLGESIQKLTPGIEEESKKIRKNFKNDINFAILSDGFDALSSTFSEVISLVIRLEHVEKKANKGNLFDSEKYINSLRTDIVGPLRSLKIFLEKQKEELLQSQKAFTKIGALDPSLHSGGQPVRVRVGGGVDSESSSEGQGHGELASKRNESLLLELTENISKLDAMIEKMG